MIRWYWLIVPVMGLLIEWLERLKAQRSVRIRDTYIAVLEARYKELAQAHDTLQRRSRS